MVAITVVIPTMGRPGFLDQALAGLDRQTSAAGEFEAVVVADAAAPADLPDAVAAERSYPLRHLRANRAGASAARNLGWRAARAPLVLFLDEDIRPTPALIHEHLDWHRRHPEPEVAVLGHVCWARELRVTTFMRWLEQGIQFDYARIRGNDAGWGRFYTCNASVKREVLERAGGFDEKQFPFGYEDLDLSKRMAEHGFRLLYNRQALGEHMRADSLDDFRRRAGRIAASERRFVGKHPDVAPYFYELFSKAAAAPRARGRSARLAKIVPNRMPVLGPLVWKSVDMRFRQALAPDFLSAWRNDGDS